MYLVLSAFISSAISLVATTKASACSLTTAALLGIEMCCCDFIGGGAVNKKVGL